MDTVNTPKQASKQTNKQMLQIGKIANQVIHSKALSSRGIKSKGFYYPFTFSVSDKTFSGMGFPFYDATDRPQSYQIEVGLLVTSTENMSPAEVRFHYFICEETIRKKIAFAFKQDADNLNGLLQDLAIADRINSANPEQEDNPNGIPVARVHAPLR